MHLSIITDEISQDLTHALNVCHELGVTTVELRMVDNTNIVFHDEASLRHIKTALDDGGFHVCAIASPFLKCALWDELLNGHQSLVDQGTDSQAAQQWEILNRSFTIAKLLGAPLVRTFSFLRVPQPITVRDSVLATLKEAVRRTEAAGLRLSIENEHACNIATGAETGWILQHLASATFGVTWDPGNEVALGSRAFPEGYRYVCDRVFHVHLKDANRHGRFVKMGTGIIDYIGQLRALAEDGYTGALSLETHYARPDSGIEGATRESLTALRVLAREAEIQLQ